MGGQLNEVIIYGLADPRTGQLRYVGKTQRGLMVRLGQHIRRTKGRTLEKWIIELKAARLKPEIFEIERVGLREWQAAEDFWIGYFKFVGADLLNKLSESRRSVLHSEETIKRLSEISMARMADPAERSLRSDFAKAMWQNPDLAIEMREKICIGLRSPAARARNSAAKKINWTDGGYRAKRAESLSKIDLSGKSRLRWARQEYRDHQAASRAAANIKRSETMKKVWAARKAMAA